MPTPRLTWPQLFTAYGVTLIAMSLLDALWLGWLARGFYQHEMGALMTDSVRIVPAALYYVMYPAAIVYLALTPAPPRRGVAVLRSAVLGLAAFGVYDLTNLATLRGYSVAMTLVDMAWGTLATALGGGLAYTLVVARATEP
ncbi:MAG: DUF2177 family protein [Burkholderiales bacterium]|nr:DUF2177 family protein [Burkholderiales bacterium]